MEFAAVIELFPDVDRTELIGWIEYGWVCPVSGAAGDPRGETQDSWVFEDIDVARVGLIRDLRHDLGLGPDSIPVILSLLDQLYQTRRALKGVVLALDRQPPELRRAVLAALDEPRAP